MIALLLFGILFLLLFLGVPIAVSLGVSTAAAMVITGNINLLPAITQRMFTQTDNFTLMAVPFFILAGNIMEKGGISKHLIDFIATLVRRQPGKLASIAVVASAFFGAISGSNPATVAAIGGITVPRMKEKGYPSEAAGAVAASAGTLGVVIPPSIPMVTYAVTASVSVGTMFLAGIFPGILLAVVLVITNTILCKKYDPAEKSKLPKGAIGKAFINAIWAILMPVIILGGIYGGIFTPTESAAVATVYSLIISLFVYKDCSFKDLYGIFRDSAVSSAVVMFVIGLSAPFAWFMTHENLPAMIANAIIGAFSGNRIILLLIVNLILLFLGMFLETQSIILLITPILAPMATTLFPQYGAESVFPLVVMGIIIVINTSIGMITPPMAVNLFVASGISKSSIGAICKRIIPYLIVEVLVLLVMGFIPQIISWLPTLTGVV